MAESLELKTPKNWSELLRDLDLMNTFDGASFELNVSHIHNPSLEGIYTRFYGLGSVYEKYEFKGHRLDARSSVGRKGKVMNLDSFSPVIIPNPVSINFSLDQKRDFVFAMDFLQRFNDAGYVPTKSSQGLYFLVYNGKYNEASITMGHQSTALIRSAERWFSQQHIDSLKEKYGVVENKS